mmetsp:Transcript_27837/g.32953  ORF Transcript_27837/g.32953 Transcript_27837/m.32953 type:complete len:569 (-) Transcript_27837:98-1804(-)
MRPSKKISSDGNNRRMISEFSAFAIIILGCLAMTSIINMLYHRSLTGAKSAHQTATDAFKTDIADGFGVSSDQPLHNLAGLSCAKYGGPSDDATNEMVYWSDIPSDSSYVSPFKKKASGLLGKDRVQYMTFIPDSGGWNNIRMAMETVVVMAHAMGRTLVLPPGQRMYLLGKNRDKQKTHFSFADFFHLDSINLEHAGIAIISTEEFLLREAMTGNLKNKTSGLVSFPPFNRTNWDGEKMDDLKKYLRDVTLTPLWAPSKCIATFPASADYGEADGLNTMLETIIKDNEAVPEFLQKPTPVDAAPIERMKEMRSKRKELCIYDEEMQNAPVLHFMCYHKMRVRLLVHFYAFLFFEDWKQQLWTSRFVRDHLRYIDELQCVAARVVEAIREKAKTNGDPKGIFDTFHVRRGDFQYKDTRVDAEVLYKNSADLIPENATLYIATDERDSKFFDPIKQHYKVYFLDDFKHLFKDLNTNYYGMLDQLIASKGRTFVGTYHSTFTGYIDRMRGYHAQKYKLQGYEMGTIESYYFVPVEKKSVYQKYAPVRGPFFSREFPVSWRDIDKGIGKLS